MKKALILEASIFSEALESQKIFESLGYKSESLFLSDRKPTKMEVWPEADLVLLRGPWKLCSEEVLAVRSFVQNWRPQLEHLMAGKESKPKLIGMGRGALVLFYLLAGQNSPFADWNWESVLKDEGPWVDAQMEGQSALFKALFYDHFRPDPSNPTLFKMEPWIKVSETLMGWKMQNRIYLSLLDLFAFQDRAQHADFGYADLSQLSMPQDILSELFAAT